MAIGQLGSLNYRMTFPQQQSVGQPSYTQPMGAGNTMPDSIDDPLAVREKLTSDYFNNYGLLQSFAQDMARKGINAFEPDYSQDGGGLAFQTMLKLKAGTEFASNALANELKAEQQMRPLEATGQTRFVGERTGMFASNPDNYMPTAVDPRIDAANKRTSETYYTQTEADKANELFYNNAIQAIQNDPSLSQQEKEYQIGIAQRAIKQTPASAFSYRNDGSGAGSGISAYVTKWSELANGQGFEAGETFDEQGNRVDVARPSEFAGRQLGFTKDGKKFIIDRFEKKVQPDGGYLVEAVDATGRNRAAVDPSNIVGSLRSFIETNEGATALKDLNRFFMQQGFNTATDSVPANLYAPRNQDVSNQTSTAPQVQSIRNQIGYSLDALGGGLMTNIGNALKSTFRMYGDIKPTELEYTTKDGRVLRIERDGDDYKIANYQDLYGRPKNGQLKIGNQTYNVKGTFEKVPKSVLQAMLEKSGVVNVKLKDAEGKTVGSSKSIKASDIPSKAASAGYSPDEYRQLLEQRGVQIVE